MYQVKIFIGSGGASQIQGLANSWLMKHRKRIRSVASAIPHSDSLVLLYEVSTNDEHGKELSEQELESALED